MRIEICVIKVKNIASKSFKGKGVNSGGGRLIHAYIESKNKIVVVELYHKSKKQFEDKERILSYFG